MFTTLKLRCLASTLFMICAGLFLLNGASSAQSTQLPITDFLNALGPGAVQPWVDPLTSGSGNFLTIDIYGKRNSFLSLNAGTTIKGKVTVQNLGDGTQRVTVNIHTKNAVCWGFNSAGAQAFGYTPLQVQGGATASLGDAMSRIVFSPQPVGPPTYNFNFIDTFHATIMCDGVLRAGSGYPDGTEGFAQTTQTGLFNTGVPAGCPPEQDGNCFPAEKIQFKPTGN